MAKKNAFIRGLTMIFREQDISRSKNERVSLEDKLSNGDTDFKQ